MDSKEAFTPSGARHDLIVTGIAADQCCCRHSLQSKLRRKSGPYYWGQLLLSLLVLASLSWYWYHRFHSQSEQIDPVDVIFEKAPLIGIMPRYKKRQ